MKLCIAQGFKVVAGVKVKAGRGGGGRDPIGSRASRQKDLLHWSLFQLVSQWNGRTQQVSLKPQSLFSGLVGGFWEVLNRGLLEVVDRK